MSTPFSEFSNKLANEQNYRDYYSYLFDFVHDLANDEGNNKKFLNKAIKDLGAIKQFLKDRNAVPKNISFESRTIR